MKNGAGSISMAAQSKGELCEVFVPAIDVKVSCVMGVCVGTERL